MEIIKTGDPNKKDSKKLKSTCKNCNCEFYFELKEVMHREPERESILDDGLTYVTCPWCGCVVSTDDKRRLFNYAR